MDFVRTPEERFANLADYPFKPRYCAIPAGDGDSLRVHYLDEGPEDGRIVLLLHGQPTWSYLYRHMIPLLVAAGHRVVAPDLVGFGRSDKPIAQDSYTYANHVGWMSSLLEQLDLSGITLFCQDWGGLIGLRLVAAYPERFSGVVVANTGLPIGQIPAEMSEQAKAIYQELPVVETEELGERFRDRNSPVPGFLYWRKYCAATPALSVSELMKVTAAGTLAPEALEGYDAPFPDDGYMAGARKFPSLVPIFADDPAIPDNQAAWRVLETFDKPLLTAFADDDPVTAGGHAVFQQRVPGAKGMPHRTIENAGHFVQEDQPEACVDAILAVMDAAD
jgi:haloalkane dehalogenase